MDSKTYIGFGGHGNQKRDIIHIFDVCEIIYLQIKNIKKIYNETFNVGGGTKNSISLKLLTKKCEVLTGNKLKIGKQKKTSIYDIPSFVVDNSKIKKFYKWQPKKNINDILNDIYEWLNSNKKIRKYFI